MHKPRDPRDSRIDGRESLSWSVVGTGYILTHESSWSTENELAIDVYLTTHISSVIYIHIYDIYIYTRIWYIYINVYDMIYIYIWYDMIWYDMIWYDMIYIYIYVRYIHVSSIISRFGIAKLSASLGSGYFWSSNHPGRRPPRLSEIWPGSYQEIWLF